MKKFKVGDIVAIPKTKSTGNRIGNSPVIERAKENGQEHLIVCAIKDDIYLLNTTFNDTGDFFLEQDLKLYSFCIKAEDNQRKKGWKVFINYINRHSPNFTYEGVNYDNYYGISNEGRAYEGTIIGGFDYIKTLEWFMDVVGSKLTKGESMQKVSKKDLEKIHDIACNDWKAQIIEYANRSPFTDDVKLTVGEIDAMFKAATKDQLPLLEEIFGKREDKLNFSGKLITDEVDGIKIFGNSDDSTSSAFIGLPDKASNTFYLNFKYNWKLDGYGLTVTRK